MKKSNMNKVVAKSILSLLTLLLLLTSNITVYAELNKLEHKSSLFLKATVKDGELLFLMDFENKVIAFGYRDAAGYLIGGAPHEQFSMGFYIDHTQSE